jgi:uncharacterized protein (DUF2147 family)
MHKRHTTLILATAMLVLGAAPALAANFDPRGRWQTTTGESRYDFGYCGDGSKLCATLVWLNADAMNTPARRQLGTHAVESAAKTGSNTWRGPLTYDGMTADTTLTQTGPKTLTIAGCYFIWCKSFDLVKISQ